MDLNTLSNVSPPLFLEAQRGADYRFRIRVWTYDADRQKQPYDVTGCTVAAVARLTLAPLGWPAVIDGVNTFIVTVPHAFINTHSFVDYILLLTDPAGGIEALRSGQLGVV